MKALFFIFISYSLVFSSIVLDKKTNLIWQDNSDAILIKKDYNGAKNYCAKLVLSGFDDWHLPTQEELLSITDKNRYNPSIKKSFKYSNSGYYWSSSVNIAFPSFAWYVYFKHGYSFNSVKTTQNNVRCVRVKKQKVSDFNSLVFKLVESELKKFPSPPKNIELEKDEFETTSEFDKRVLKTQNKNKIIVEKYKKRYASAKQKAKQKAIKKALEITWGKPIIKDITYNADNGYFIGNMSFEVKKDFNQKVAVKIDRKKARDFKKHFSSLKPKAIFSYDGENVRLKAIKVAYRRKKYLVQFTDMDIDDERMAIEIKNDIDLQANFTTKVGIKKNEIATLNSYKINDFYDLDKMLKKKKYTKIDKKKWLFVIGIEKYEYTDNIRYAKKSAELFAKAVQKRLGVARRNSFVLINDNATQAEIKTKFRKMLHRVKKGDTIYFYYNGHGIPIPSLNNQPFMLASNSEPDYISDESFFSLQNLYIKLGNSKASKIIAIIDSCFSGVTDGKAVLKGVAATKMVAKPIHFNKEKMVVITAGKGNQYSNGYDRKAHRLFSYYVIKNIIKGTKDIKTLYKDTKSKTYETSLEEYGDLRVQEPTINGNYRMKL